ncbi:hypothetical protein [Streptomyces sp. NBC_00207]
MTARNGRLVTRPGLVNDDPYGGGWLIGPASPIRVPMAC